MASEILKFDQNSIRVLAGVTDDVDQDIMMLRVDPITKRLLVKANVTGAVSSVSNVDGSLTISPTTGDVIASLNVAHENTWTVGQIFNEVDLTKTPLAPSSSSATFVLDAGGIQATGITYQYYIYSYYYSGSAYAYDAVGIYTVPNPGGGGLDPNDSLFYRQDLTWSDDADANGYLIYNFMTSEWLDVGNVTSYTINASTSWNGSGSFPSLTPNSLVDYGHPIWLNKGADWTNTSFNAIALGLSGTSHLQMRWLYNGGTGAGALRFESDDGTIRYINANLYAENITLTNTLTGGNISSYIYPTTFGTNYIAYGASGGYITGGSMFTFDQSTTRMLLSNSGITPRSQLHMNYSTATAVNIQFTNSSTGTTASDGTLVGITPTGVFEIKQQENSAVNVYTLGTLRATYAASASPRYTVYGGIEAQYFGLANTSTDGFLVSNTTSATAGVPIQRAGRLHWYSNVWDTTSSSSRIDDWIIEPTLTSGATPSSVLTFARQYNAGGYVNLITLGSDGFLKLIPSASGGAGTNRTIDFGNGYGNPAIYLYNAGATTRHGWGMQAGAMQFFQPTATGNIFTWNAGGDLQASGTNELMRLVQFASGKGGLSIAGAGGAFNATSPYKLELDGESLAGGTAGVEGILRLRRGQTGGVSYPEAFAIALGRYSSSGTGPDTRVDFQLKSIAATDFTTDATVLTLQSDLKVILYGDLQMADAKNFVLQTTTGTKLGTSTTQKLGFWNATPIIQPTTSVGSATLVSPGAGTNIKSDDTFDGYTLQQIVKALRNTGLLA